jgi:glycosyltransferase 2 family protein
LNATRRRALIGLGIAVTAVFGYVAVRDAHPAEVWEALRESEWLWLLPALAVMVIAVFLRAVRWWALFEPETRPPLGAVVEATVIGYFFNNLLPLRAGEAARVVALRRRTRTSWAETGATVVLERAFDVVAVLVLLFVLVPWLPEVRWLRLAAALAAALLAVLAGAAVALAVWGDRPVRLVLRPLARLVAPERVELGVGNLTRGLAGLRRLRVAAPVLALTLVSWVVLGISTWLAMLGFHLGLSPIAGIFVMLALGLAAILPASPAGVGVFEAAVVIALSAYGVGHSEALSYGLVLHALNFFPFIVAGLVVLRRRD